MTTVLGVPYSCGIRGLGMGAGPAALMERHGLAGELIDLPETPAPEIARTFELNRRLGEAVAGADTPLVLSGECNCSWGATAGAAGDAPPAVLWLDAHADFDRPDDNLSGFLDVMALSTLTGACWQALAATIPGFRPVPEENVVLAGVRDLAPYQRERLAASRVGTVPGSEPALGERTIAALGPLRERSHRLYLHIDADCLDAEAVGPANRYAAPGGFRLEEVLVLIAAAQERFELVCASLTAYDPSVDAGGAVAEALGRIARALGATG